MDKQHILKVIKERDQVFIKKFCQQGHYLADGGEEIMHVCRPVNVDEVLTFMHQWDAVILEGTEYKA